MHASLNYLNFVVFPCLEKNLNSERLITSTLTNITKLLSLRKKSE